MDSSESSKNFLLFTYNLFTGLGNESLIASNFFWLLFFL